MSSISHNTVRLLILLSRIGGIESRKRLHELVFDLSKKGMFTYRFVSVDDSVYSHELDDDLRLLRNAKLINVKTTVKGGDVFEYIEISDYGKEFVNDLCKLRNDLCNDL
ncbi:MAG TPA: hypothetical protein ENF75_01810, partial [Acidilobales archaeon]|nr:hypothetical protein [Acidilobales archaeon]